MDQAKDNLAQAYQIITELKNKLDEQRKVYEEALEEGYAGAYEMLTEERGKNCEVECLREELKQEREKNEKLEERVYDEYDKKLRAVKDYIVEKVDKFLGKKHIEQVTDKTGKEIVDEAIGEDDVYKYFGLRRNQEDW